MPQGIWWFGFAFFSIVVFILLMVAIKSFITNKKNEYTGVSRDQV